MKFRKGSLYARRFAGIHDINTARNIKVSLAIGKIKAINLAGSEEPILPINESEIQFKVQQEKQRFAKQNQSVARARRKMGTNLLKNQALQKIRFQLQQGRREIRLVGAKPAVPRRRAKQHQAA